jgi:nitroimidazol reductase NimA-like FMN-containing flavoprotein (pyridoxamine 5'-phosphate oxidase superfamily)
MGVDVGGESGRARFEELTEGECRTLLRSRTVGRLGFVTAEGPQIIPVNYVLDGSDIIFRTASYTQLGRDAPNSRVAFEIDDLDESGRTGWSVLLVGRAERVEDEEEALELWDKNRPEPWALGTRTLLIRIRTSAVSGRRVVAP